MAAPKIFKDLHKKSRLLLKLQINRCIHTYMFLFTFGGGDRFMLMVRSYIRAKICE